MPPFCSLGIDENGRVLGRFEQNRADELLNGGNGLAVRHAQVGQVLEILVVLLEPHQTHERLDLFARDVLLQQLSIAVQQCSDGLFSEHVEADVGLHETKLFGYIFLFFFISKSIF